MGAEHFPNPDGHRTARIIDGRALASRIARETRTKIDEARSRAC